MRQRPKPQNLSEWYDKPKVVLQWFKQVMKKIKQWLYFWTVEWIKNQSINRFYGFASHLCVSVEQSP